MTELKPLMSVRWDQLKFEKNQLIKYIQVKIGAEDWHAVSDAANDIREIDAKFELIKEIENE